jgi:sugar (pentulose or hexulose) kinase
MDLVAGLDVGGSAVKAWTGTLDGRPTTTVVEPLETLRPRSFSAEFDPGAWWEVCGRALRRAVEQAERHGEVVGVTAGSLRQGFVLVGADGELGNGVLNSDRRGASQLDELRRAVGSERLYRVTGHWPAPELTLPKLMDVRSAEPSRWLATRTVLFVHDWLLWRLSGETVSEASLASAGQMADVRARTWAAGLLDEVGVGTEKLAPVVEAGTVVGPLAARDLGLPAGIPVVSGGGDTQLAAMGAGGLAAGTVTVVAGSTTPVQAATGSAPDDPLRHPWVSTHLRPDLWAVETNAGYAGMMLDWLAAVTGSGVSDLAAEAARSEPGARGLTAAVAAPVWSEERWALKPPSAVLGFTPSHSVGDLARAFLEGHAYAVRSNLEDLARAIGTGFARVLVTGGAAQSPEFCRLLAGVTGRTVEVPEVANPAAVAGAALVARALGAAVPAREPDFTVYAPAEPAAYDGGYERFLRASDVLQTHLPKEAA